jgi:N-acetyltransferase
MAAIMPHGVSTYRPNFAWASIPSTAKTDEIVGGTAFLAADEPNRSVEIGATWITPPSRRRVVNTEAKLLQLTHAFETLGCERVSFETDARNDRSRAAIARIGATEDGTFRHHMLLPTARGVTASTSR